MPQGSSGEWHTGEVVSLCESYGFIRKDGERPDIFMHYDDVEGFEPQIGDRVSFELAADARFPDRQKAVAVEYSGRPRPVPAELVLQPRCPTRCAVRLAWRSCATRSSRPTAIRTSAPK